MGIRAAEELRLLCEGRRLAIPDEGLTIGRDDGNDLTLDDDAVSRRHAVLRQTPAGAEIEDCGSANGTFVNGERLSGESRAVGAGDVLGLGGQVLHLLGDDETDVLEAGPATGKGAWRLLVDDERLTVGRDPGNDVVLDDPNVSRWHLEVVRQGDGFAVHDLGSRNGTWVDGRRVGRARIDPGGSLRVGRFRIFVEHDGLVGREDRREACLEASSIRVTRGGTDIVAGASFEVRSGELVAIIGRSGCGKTTLIKALAGVMEPDDGAVTLDGEPVRSHLPEIGYLPQDESVHPQLTPREALGYAARLRLPSDVTDTEIEQLTARVLDDLDLAHRADTRIGRLSGGERRRTGLAAELLGRPAVLFLDEPTTGLDPGLEAQTMDMLAQLAERGPGVVVVTHATASLERCRRLVVMGPGGRPHFDGPPREALAHFGVERYEDIYAEVADATPPPPAARRDLEPPRGGSEARALTGTFRQFQVLVARYAKTFVRDRRNLAITLLQVPILGVALGLLLSGDVFARGRSGNPNDGAQILFLLSTTALWLGAIASAREIVKERGVLARERAVGVRLHAYLASKVTVIFGLIALETTALTAIVVSLRPLHAEPAVYAHLFLLMVVTGCVAAAMGLMISAAARSQDQATTFIPLALVPQLLFGGALVPVSKMGDLMGAVSNLMPSRWSFASLGTSVDLAERLRADPYDAR